MNSMAAAIRYRGTASTMGIRAFLRLSATIVCMFHGYALYIHVPFCRSKCGYCSFVSEQGREDDIPLYVEALIDEIARRAAGKEVSSIYFGGGTPSLLAGGQVEQLLEAVRSICIVKEKAEISLEANPGTVDIAFLSALRKLGINRLSLGIQSFQDNELTLLGRVHSAAQAQGAVGLARAAGFDNVSLDLIYGLPGGTLDGWRRTLERALLQDSEHISLYSLTLEGDVPLQRMIAAGELPPPDPDLTAAQYELAEDMLAAGGYIHYEISNWARPGRECRHNIVYWRNMPYIGVGVAAHSSLEGHRTGNTTCIDTYLDAYKRGTIAAFEIDETIDRELALAETIIMGLRLCCGIECAVVEDRFQIDVRDRFRRQIGELEGYGLLECGDGCIKLTQRGRLLANEVFWRFLPEAAVR